MNKKLKVILSINALCILISSSYFYKQHTFQPSYFNSISYFIDYYESEELNLDENWDMSESLEYARTEIPIAQPPQVIVIADKPVEEKSSSNIVSRGTSSKSVKPAETPKPKPSPKPASSPAAPIQTPRPTTSPQTFSSISKEERELFARLVSAESAGESFDGKLAVATVIMNRVESNIFSNTITGVIYGKDGGYYQFSPVYDGRINEPATADSLKAVDMVLNGHRSFGTKVMWFLNPRTAISSWITSNKVFFRSIGNHDFYY